LALVRTVARGGIPIGDIPNLVLCTEGEIRATPRAPETNSLGDHPVPWSQFIDGHDAPVAFLRTARGCTFRCAFCNYPALAGGHEVVTVEAMCKELAELQAAGVRDVAFVDDTFNVPLPRFKSLLREMIQQRFDLRWTSFFRCSNADEECFDLMAESGCQAVFLGIESGDKDILKGMNKKAKPEAYVRGIAALRERDILTMASYIMGFPGETAESAQRTLDFIEENPTTFYNIELYYHDALAPVETLREQYQISGTAYSWSHASMNWREAADWVEFALARRCESVPLPLYGFSVWALPYFQSLGFSRKTFTDFTRLAAHAFQDGLRGNARVADFVPRFSEVVSKSLLDASLLGRRSRAQVG
jgi:p-methyltransferase